MDWILRYIKTTFTVLPLPLVGYYSHIINGDKLITGDIVGSCMVDLEANEDCWILEKIIEWKKLPPDYILANSQYV